MNEHKEMLVPHETYLKSGIHIGTKFRTKAMDKFIYKTRADGLSVLNLQKINERLKIAGRFLSDFEPKDVLIICRRENGWKAIKKFGEVTGIDVFAKRYPPGVLTNIELEDFIEKKIIFVVDEWADRNAIKDAVKMGISVIALCDTNNHANNIDFIIPCNNKGHKSLGLMFFILAREYFKNTEKAKSDKEIPFKVEEFMNEEL